MSQDTSDLPEVDALVAGLEHVTQFFGGVRR